MGFFTLPKFTLLSITFEAIFYGELIGVNWGYEGQRDEKAGNPLPESSQLK
jgi:hypothetical protein